MEWSQRKATHTAQKIPDDWEDQCERSFFQKAYQIKEHDIPAPLYINSDQTNAIHAPGDKMTWAKKGSKQVALVSSEEKHMFTVMVSVTSDATLLLFQAIYQGKSKVSCPSSKARYLAEAKAAGILFKYSGTTTYWSDQQMMQSFVNKILAPYFNGKKQDLGLPKTQCTLWQINVWSVHRSQEFWDWMRDKHPTILVDFIPGGCTGIHQPCNVGIQCPLQLSLKCSYHEDVINQFLTQFDEKEDGEPEALIFN
ncbi:hypothetical protein L208DRAFT_1233626 [Tricholoma matsutake]|nr:hypothetical protein L208DRAFT_1233626 [Tricholoma matsutake 945]